jgi:cell shape-determining protein MreC
MNYLLDKKIKRNRPIRIAIFILVVVIIFFFRSSIFNGLTYVSSGVFRPVFTYGGSVGQKIRSLQAYFISKNSLYNENLELKSKIERDLGDRANYDSVVSENLSLKEILNRKGENRNLILASILAKPNQSVYDTLVIDIGTNHGIEVGNKVFALGNIPIGHVAEVAPGSSKVVLFSSSGETTQVVVMGKPEISPETSEALPNSIGNISLEIIGRGGGNFEMILPRDAKLTKGDQVVLPGINPYVVGIVETIISDPRDSFQKALLIAPVNIQNLKFVEVEKNL